MQFEPALLSRIEDATLNASAPPGQRWLDGWLVRRWPGKARRARCINALAPGRMSLDERLALGAELYAQAALAMHIRITPFSQPATLDEQLHQRGWSRIEETLVMARLPAPRSTPPGPPEPPAGLRLAEVDAQSFASVVGALRGSTPEEVAAHADRVRSAPVPYRALVLWADGAPAACAQSAWEDRLTGLYDVFTAPAWRGQRLAGLICERLLSESRPPDRQVAYLQVSAENHAAQATYRRLGFVEAYRYHYHYRTPPG